MKRLITICSLVVSLGLLSTSAFAQECLESYMDMGSYGPFPQGQGYTYEAIADYLVEDFCTLPSGSQCYFDYVESWVEDFSGNWSQQNYIQYNNCPW